MAAELEGKRINRPMRTLVDVFGLDPDKPTTGAGTDKRPRRQARGR